MTLAATRTRGSKVVGYEQGGQRLTIEGGNEIDFCHEAEEGNGNDFEDDITPLFMRLLGALEQRSALQQQLGVARLHEVFHVEHEETGDRDDGVTL